MRAILDTNLFISYLLDPFAESPPAACVNAAIRGGAYDLVVPAKVLDELLDVCTTKTYLSSRIRREFLAQTLGLIRDGATIVPTLPSGEIPTIVRDQKDDFLLATAVLEQVDALVSGDKDLLVLGEVGSVRIVSPADFLALIER